MVKVNYSLRFMLFNLDWVLNASESVIIGALKVIYLKVSLTHLVLSFEKKFLTIWTLQVSERWNQGEASLTRINGSFILLQADEDFSK